MAFTAAQWKAINWYKEYRGWTIRDMAAGPIIRFRDENDKIQDINIEHVLAKYRGRPKGKKKVES